MPVSQAGVLPPHSCGQVPPQECLGVLVNGCAFVLHTKGPVQPPPDTVFPTVQWNCFYYHRRLGSTRFVGEPAGDKAPEQTRFVGGVPESGLLRGRLKFASFYLWEPCWWLSNLPLRGSGRPERFPVFSAVVPLCLWSGTEQWQGWAGV